VDKAINRQPSLNENEDRFDDEVSHPIKRYRHVVSRWNREIGKREDADIGNFIEPWRKGNTSEVAFTFRRKMSLNNQFNYSEVEIEARGLRGLLKEVIGDSYPGHSSGLEKINMTCPFTPIVHNWDKLVEAVHDNDGDDPERREAREDLRNLLDYVRNSTELEVYFKTRESNLYAKVTTYETLWTLFCPGKLVIAHPFMNIPQIFKVKSSPDPWEDSREDSQKSVECWCYDYNGIGMVKASFDFPIEKFRGTKDITALFCYPLKYYKNENGESDPESLRRMLIDRGQKFEALCRVPRGAKQMFEYDDVALLQVRMHSQSKASLFNVPL
jgi:hypothetical protein